MGKWTKPNPPSSPTTRRISPPPPAKTRSPWSGAAYTDTTNGGTAITGYTVEHCDRGLTPASKCIDTSTWTTASVSATATSYTISSLIELRTYDVAYQSQERSHGQRKQRNLQRLQHQGPASSPTTNPTPRQCASIKRANNGLLPHPAVMEKLP